MLSARLSGHSLGGLILYSLRIPEGKLEPEAPQTRAVLRPHWDSVWNETTFLLLTDLSATGKGTAGWALPDQTLHPVWVCMGPGLTLTGLTFSLELSLVTELPVTWLPPGS